MAKGGLLREKGFQSSESFVVEVLEEEEAVKGGEGSPGGETNVRSALPESEGFASPGHGDGEPRDEPHHLLSVRGRDSPAFPCHHLQARLPGDRTCGQRTPDSSGGEDPCQGEGTQPRPRFPREQSEFSCVQKGGNPVPRIRDLPYPSKSTKPHSGWVDACSTLEGGGPRLVETRGMVEGQ